MKTAIYAGSFDPFTIGHLNVLREATYLFDKTIIAVSNNPGKIRKTNPDLMLKAIEESIFELQLNNLAVVKEFHGLIADLAEKERITYLIRGIRNGMDYEYEENLAKINESLGLKTIYIRAGNLSHVSSSMVMELYKYGRDISPYVPFPVLEAIKNSINT